MLRPIVFIIIIVTLFIFAIVSGVGEKIGVLREWIQSLGDLGPVAFVAFYALGVVAGIPGSALTVAIGTLFGSSLGVVMVSLASTLGASLAFLIARYFARDQVAQWLLKRERFKKLDDMAEKHGAIIVALTRLVPLFPFNLLNYGFGLTKIPFRTYVFWSWLCMLPGTVLYVVGVDAIFQTIVYRKVPWILIGVVVLAGGILVFLVRFARRKMKEGENGC